MSGPHIACVKLFAAICFHGIASWYGPGFEGKLAANGKPYHQAEMTAASRTIKLGSVVEVVNLANGRHVHVQITDRGPYVDMDHRMLDLSRAAARHLDFEADGLAYVEYRIVAES